MTVVSMSKQEFSRLEVLLQVQSGRLRIADACELIGLRRRQVFRLLRALKQDGVASLVSKRHRNNVRVLLGVNRTVTIPGTTIPTLVTRVVEGH